MAESANLALNLTDLGHLFNAPPTNPLSKSAPEILGVSGADYLLNLLHLDLAKQQERTLVLLLPAAKASSSSAEEATRALRRWAEYRLERELRELRNTYHYGWRVMGVALILLALCLAASSVFAHDSAQWMKPILRKTLEYGFEIMGWVMLWHPIEALVFSPLAIRLRVSALRALASIEVAIKPDDGVAA
jgi:hypothetical protein